MGEAHTHASFDNRSNGAKESRNRSQAASWYGYRGNPLCTAETINNLSQTERRNNRVGAYFVRLHGNSLSYPSMPRQDSGLAVINSKNTHKSKKVKVNYIKDKYGTWIKVGMFSNDTYSKTNKTPTIFSETMKAVKVHYNLSTDIAQETPTAFSADFGELEASEVRILGATDFDRWEETRTIDWVYKVPKAGMFGNKYEIKYQNRAGFIWSP